MALSPWPTTPAALAAATATLKAAIAGDSASDAEVQRVGAVASVLVEREAPDAPDAIRDEALIRMAGYLLGSDFGGVREEEIGPRRVEYAPNHGMAFRHSGAKALLAPWRVRRAGAIG